ncbi:uncharacterized protein DNG_05539 [Cephalotrichum gorgonifer]|uniref:WD40 domain-containing protein n=1 Tax=Cephalotrichum gorgonifer TaxID=2041049 RepID=A0AAE8N134_9PEZI|nr:uncharacterized protein DNG_05539 [Cephalotrichum gorgonifer]
MPKIKSYTPAWLAKGSPGNNLFAPTIDVSRASVSSPYSTKSKKRSPNGPRRTIARRGTEVFVASGREIRWGDLVYLKEMYASQRASARVKREDSSGDDTLESIEHRAAGYRILTTPVADDIKQLIISPNGNLLAIATSHTVHICLLPDPSHLSSEDTDPIRPKIWTLGPTTHVTSRSPIASLLWHPLGVNGSCLVTVSTDSIVRVWELSVADRWSFDSPTISIDLKRLADGTSLDQDFTASTSATNTGFSPDSFEMEVASACFGSRSSGGWNPFTLWIAMREGDVYALCPLLPTKWAPPSALIASLSVSIVTKVGAIEDDPTVSETQKLLAQQQLAWMGDVDSQEPQVIDGSIGEPPVEVYTRPSKPGAVPRLQGPFEFIASPESDDDIDTELTDILVIGSKVDADELMGDDSEYDLDETDREGLSLSVICLLSTSGQVKVCLDLEGVEAQWLPPKNMSKLGRLLSMSDNPSLLTFQAMDSMTPVEADPDAWPVFSVDVMSRYSFFVTHHAGITFFSLAPWVFRLEGEIQGAGGAGGEFRLGLLVDSNNSIRERLFTQPTADTSAPLAACSAISDPDVGYAAISATAYDPVVLIFDTPEDDFTLIKEEDEDEASPVREVSAEPIQPLYSYEPRPAFQVSHVFDQGSQLPLLLEGLRSSRHRAVVSQEIRLSPLTLQVLTEAHKMLSEETHRLGLAASELFLKCDRMRSEMQDHLAKAAETKSKIDKIVGRDGAGDEGSDRERIDERISRAKRRHEELARRLEAVRKTVAQRTTREISHQERAWMEEVRGLEASVLGGTGGSAAAPSSGRVVPAKQAKRRVEEVTSLVAELMHEAESLGVDGKSGGAGAGAGVGGVQERGGRGGVEVRVPGEIRRAKIQQVRNLLEREEAMVAAVSNRLEKLQMGLQ